MLEALDGSGSMTKKTAISRGLGPVSEPQKGTKATFLEKKDKVETTDSLLHTKPNASFTRNTNLSLSNFASALSRLTYKKHPPKQKTKQQMLCKASITYCGLSGSKSLKQEKAPNVQLLPAA